MASSLTEPRYFDKLKIKFFQDENGIAFVTQFLDETGYQVCGSACLLCSLVFAFVRLGAACETILTRCFGS